MPRIHSAVLLGLLAICMGSCALDDGVLDPAKILTIQTSPASILADGRSVTTLTATLGEAADPNLAVVFRTDAGAFAGTGRQNAQEVTIPASFGVATATLISSTEVQELVLVSAEIQGIGEDNATSFKTFDSLSFTRAFPEEMQFTADRLRLVPDQFQTATLTVSLFRQGEGSVSGGSLIRFSATPVDTSLAVASLPDFIYADAEQATIEVKSQTSDAGPVSITAETEKADGSLLQKTIIITFAE